MSFTSGAATGASYNVASGLLTLPALTSDAVGAVQSFSVGFAAPTQSYVVSSAVSTATPETALTNNAASVATTVTPTADVAVAIAGPTSAVAGNPVTYTVAVTNNGVNTATSVVPTLQLPAGLTLTESGPGTVTIDANGRVTFPTIAGLQAGVTSEYYVTFNMPASPANGQLTPLAAVTTGSYDNVASNNTAGLTTSLALATTNTTDLVTSVSLAANGNTNPANIAPGNNLTYTVGFRNQATGTTALNAVGTVTLPAGLGGSLVVGTGTGTLSANTGLYTYSNGATYDPATGLLSIALGNLPYSAAGGPNAVSFNASFAAPNTGQLVVVSAINSATPEATNATGANRSNNSTTVTPTFDLITSIQGPTAALAGAENVYTVTSTNNGPSMVTTVTQTATLPQNLTGTTLLVGGQTGTGTGTVSYPNGASYVQSTGVLTFAPIARLATGATGAVSNTFALFMPGTPTATTSLTLTANTSTSALGVVETNTTNNGASITTQTPPLSLAPVAANIINSLQSARGNTSPTNLAISPLVATDADGNIPTSGNYGYFVQSLPLSGIGASAGTLYYNGTAITSIPTGGFQVLNPALLSFKPAASFVGNAFFTYTALDNTGVSSPVALYTIPVAKDQSSTYDPYNTGKGGANPYVTGDVLAAGQDVNTDIFNSAGLLYNASTGALQTGAANGIQSVTYTGTLPAGVTVALTATTITVNSAPVQIPAGTAYVSNAALLPRVTAATNYPITVTTTDLNGGVNTVSVTVTLGAYPLPVQLVAFTAQAMQNRDGLLKWTTASELTNDHFEVERSLDGSSFSKLGQVAGQGSKASATDYAFTDAGIGLRVAAGQPVYYRLKQVDANGTTKVFRPTCLAPGRE
ncbi:MAG: hypothetical protein EOO59_04125 [Hymenobacter sp.]|nr:MAG: hypothetical protein EOO59_04125 [Hymenobacter sp.]